MRYITKNELEKIREKSLESNLYKDQSANLIIETLINTGVRVSELITITPNDLRETQIIIRGKGNKIRNIDVSSNILFSLKSHVKQNRVIKNQVIFPYTRDGISKICKRISDFTPHAFRHSYAIELLRRTKNIKYVQEQLGHETLKTTEVYLKYMEFDTEKKLLGSLFT